MKRKLFGLVTLICLAGAMPAWGQGLAGRPWSRIRGTSSIGEAGKGITVDQRGTVYLTGQIVCSDGEFLDGQEGVGGADACLMAYDPEGEHLWTRIWGSEGGDTGIAPCVDASNRVYVAGYTDGGFDAQTNAGPTDAFLTSYTTNGTRQWTRIWGSSGGERAWGSCQAGDRVFVVGYSAGAFDGETNAGGADAFLTAIDLQGSTLWSRIWGSSSYDDAYGVCVVGTTAVYVAGCTEGEFGGQTNAGEYDLTLSKFTFDGSREWVRIWGSPQWDIANAVCVDSAGQVYVVGSTGGEFGGQTNGWGYAECMSTFDPDGNMLWTRIWGDGVGALAVAIGPTNTLYVHGNTGTIVEESSDFVLTKFDSFGSRHWSIVWGDNQGNHNFHGPSVCCDTVGNIYSVGSTQGGWDGQTNSGGSDICVSKFEDPLSFEILQVRESNEQIVLTWPGAWNCVFDVEVNADLVDTNAWAPAAALTNLPGGEHMVVTNSAAATLQAFRVRARDAN